MFTANPDKGIRRANSPSSDHRSTLATLSLWADFSFDKLSELEAVYFCKLHRIINPSKSRV